LLHRWYEESFGEDYLLVYKHRDMQGAASEVRQMIGWLNLPAGSEVLDLCCGTGRHALALADAGYSVTGVDLSAVLLREAHAADFDNRIRWIQSDMRSLPEDGTFAEKFDAVVNLFTSFGYFETDSEQMKVLHQIRKALKPEGRFIVDLLNAQYTADHLVPQSKRIQDGTIIMESRMIRHGFVVKEIIVREAGRPPRRYLERVKLYTLDTLKTMLANADLVVDEIYGSYDEDPYDATRSPRMIIVGHRID